MLCGAVRSPSLHADPSFPAATVAAAAAPSPQPVTLVSNLLHMHQIGYNMSIQHYRGVPDANTSASNTSATNTNVTNSSSSHWVELEPTGNRAYFDFG